MRKIDVLFAECWKYNWACTGSPQWRPLYQAVTVSASCHYRSIHTLASHVEDRPKIWIVAMKWDHQTQGSSLVAWNRLSRPFQARLEGIALVNMCLIVFLKGMSECGRGPWRRLRMRLAFDLSKMRKYVEACGFPRSLGAIRRPCWLVYIYRECV